MLGQGAVAVVAGHLRRLRDGLVQQHQRTLRLAQMVVRLRGMELNVRMHAGALRVAAIGLLVGGIHLQHARVVVLLIEHEQVIAEQAAGVAARLQRRGIVGQRGLPVTGLGPGGAAQLQAFGIGRRDLQCLRGGSQHPGVVIGGRGDVRLQAIQLDLARRRGDGLVDQPPGAGPVLRFIGAVRLLQAFVAAGGSGGGHRLFGHHAGRVLGLRGHAEAGPRHEACKQCHLP